MATRGQWGQSLGLKAFALLLAIGLYWLAARSEVQRVTIDRVPVKVANLPANVELYEESGRVIHPPTISFDIVGPKSEVRRAANPEYWFVDIDLSRPDIAATIADGSTVVPISSDMIYCGAANLRKEIRVDRRTLSTDGILVRTKLVSKRVPVILRLQGKPASGYIVAASSVDPDYVRLTGAPETLEIVDRLNTRIADIGNLDRSLNDIIALERLPRGLDLLPGQSHSVRFSVELKPRPKSMPTATPTPKPIPPTQPE